LDHPPAEIHLSFNAPYSSECGACFEAREGLLDAIDLLYQTNEVVLYVLGEKFFSTFPAFNGGFHDGFIRLMVIVARPKKMFECFTGRLY
jgi:hypothetical protein